MRRWCRLCVEYEACRYLAASDAADLPVAAVVVRGAK